MLEEDCGWIGSTRSRETGWIAEGRRRRESRAIALRGRGKEGKGRAWGSKQLGWISDLAQPRRAFESDPKSDGWASCREGQVEIEAGFFFYTRWAFSAGIPSANSSSGPLIVHHEPFQIPILDLWCLFLAFQHLLKQIRLKIIFAPIFCYN